MDCAVDLYKVEVDLCPHGEWYEVEKRDYPRFPLAVEIRIARLSPLELPEQPPLWLRGTTENIGRGGVAILIDQLLPLDAVVCCEIGVSGSPALIPTLLKVRWSDIVEAKKQYKLGLRFLL